jgi:TM2 domain-containing membrane protein YozV/predicted Ser/Thr protein kinase
METDRICPNCRKPLPPDVPLGLCPECLIKSGFPTGTEPGSGGIGRFVPPPVEEIAKLFPQFEILSLIGKGGMGAVYKARQPGLDRFVALKVLPPVVANDPGFAERFNREARALARLSHPNIVAVYDFGTAGTLNYFVMEFVDGTNLREVERAGRLSSEQALAIVPQICEALQFAHNEGIVHRDIKPENLLMDKKGRVKITDFGIAKILDVAQDKVALTGAKDVVGTPHYMAPEQIEKPQTVDHRADIYSLGVVFYEMLTGELPLGKFSPPSKKVQVDVRLDEIVLHTLEKEPERRYQQVSQVKTDVETVAGTPPSLGAAAMVDAAPPVFPAPPQEVTSDKILLPTFLLAFFFGVFGAHRFYVGKIGTGIAQLFTLGGLGIWATIDWILILCKVFTDDKGRRITNWWHPGAPQPPAPPKSPVPPVVGGALPEGSRIIIIAPAVALLVAGCLKLFSALLILLFLQFDWRVMPLVSTFGHVGVSILPIHWGMFASFTIVLFSVVPAACTLYGAVEMIRIRHYGWAVTAAIISITSCNIIGFAAGVWALIVLLQPRVRETFANRQTPPTRETWPWILGAVAAVCLFFVLLMSLLAFLFEGPHAEPLAQASGSTAVVNVSPTPPADRSNVTRPGQAQTVQSLKHDLERDAALLQSLTNLANQLMITAQGSSNNFIEVQKQFDDLQQLLKLQEQASRNLGHPIHRANAEAELDELRDKLNLSSDSLSQLQVEINQAARQLTNAQVAVAGNTANFTVNATGAAPLSYQWYVGTTNSALPGSNGTLTLNTMPAPRPSLTAATPINQTIDIEGATDFSKSFAVEPGGQLMMDVDRGDVHITGGDQNTVEIHVEREVTKANGTDPSAILKEEHVTLEQTGNTISITAQDPEILRSRSIWNWLSGPNLSDHYEITVPRNFTVQSKTSGGDMKVADIRDSVTITTMGGRLDCQDIGGNLDGKTMGGDVQAADCKGKLHVETMGGNITIDGFSGPDIQATTEGGSVSADFAVAPTADCEMSTSGGNVTARLPETAAVTLDAHTEGGSANCDFPITPGNEFANATLKGPINGGGPKLKMETVGGNIEVLKR